MTDFEWVAAFVLATVSSARITRLVTWDAYPPVAWLRVKWDARTENSDWNLLLHCGYCFSLYVVLLVMGTAWLSIHLTGDIHLAWWLVTGWLTISYLAAICMAYDGDDA
jgi:hypothetical protein